MITITLTVGIPACGKSTWSKEELKKDPEGTVRVNRDDLRNMMSNYHFSEENERMVTSVRNFVIQQAVRRGKNVIVDETNLNRRNFDDIVKMVKQLNLDAKVIEKPFYVDLDEAIARDAARTGSAHVSEEVVRKFWKRSGGTSHKFYKPRVELIIKPTEASVAAERPEVDSSKPFGIIVDLDGTLSLFNAKTIGTVQWMFAILVRKFAIPTMPTSAMKILSTNRSRLSSSPCTKKDTKSFFVLDAKIFIVNKRSVSSRNT